MGGDERGSGCDGDLGLDRSELSCLVKRLIEGSCDCEPYSDLAGT